ncbi:hypothetical protein BD769DRAFT_609243 [Suillus cothurnatus]|nr:hypothetical protein BD769DRAFT_609243 [Suillus cothurnatus]
MLNFLLCFLTIIFRNIQRSTMSSSTSKSSLKSQASKAGFKEKTLNNMEEGVGIWLSYREMLGSSASGHQFCSLWCGNKMTSCEDMVILIW